MKALSLRRRFSDAIDTLETNYYRYADKAVTPNPTTLKAENTGPVRSNIVDFVNTTIHSAHDFVLSGVIGFSPSPNETDLVKAGVEVLSDNAHRVAPLISQFAKSPAALAGAAVLCGAAVICNPAVRDEISHSFDKVGQMATDAGNGLTEKISAAIKPATPIAVAITPTYKPSKLG